MRKNYVLTLLALTWLAASPVLAELSVRECITSPPPVGQAYLLPADGQWHDVGSLEFNHNSGSDYIITAVVDLAEGNTPNSLVEYQLTVDGIFYGWYTRRIPQAYPTTQVLRTVASNLPAGIHTIGVRARNFSAANVYYYRVWISPLLVDSSEATAVSYGPPGNITVGSTWTTLAQSSISVPAGKMVYLSGFLTVTAGTPLTAVEYRFFVTSVLERYSDTVPDVMSDGVHVAVIHKFPATGTVTYSLQARSLGASFTVGARELFAQTIPSLTVFDASGGAVSFPNDDQWHNVAQTDWISLSPSSIGTWGTDGSGYSYFTYTGSLAAEAEVEFLMEISPPNPSQWEVGWLGVHPSGYTKLEGNNSDWEQLGHQSGQTRRMTLRVRGLCENNPQPINISRSRFQVLVVPDNSRFTSAGCDWNPTVCCANNYPSCQKYDCKMLLSLVPNNFPRDCF